MKTDDPSYLLKIDGATGKTVWRVERPTSAQAESPDAYITPALARSGAQAEIVLNGDLVYAPTRVRPMLALRTGGRGDVTTSHRVWSFDNGPDVPTPVTDGTLLYVVNDKGIVWVLDAKTGAAVYGPERLKLGTYSSSPVLADGRIYVTNEDGVTSVFKAGPKFELLAENDLGDYTLSSLAVSEGQIFARTASGLYAIGKRATR
jgi:outer membrane protein assembly factor BamB